MHKGKTSGILDLFTPRPVYTRCIKMKKKKKRMLKSRKSQKKNLRAGSKEAKRILYEQNPTCDICGCKLPMNIIQFHHIFMVRHGFATRVDRACLLCPNCHTKFHKKFDKYFDRLNAENHNTDFLAIYKNVKNTRDFSHGMN